MVTRADFGTDGIRKEVGTPPVTAACFYEIGLAVAHLEQEKAPDKTIQVCIANDGRASYETLGPALTSGLLAGGAEVYDLGVIPTPGLAVLTKLRSAPAGIMVTASHNHAQYNGLKFFCGDGTKWQSANIDALVSTMSKQKTTHSPSQDSQKKTQDLHRWAQDALITYAQKALMQFPRLPKKITVVMDCAYGATGEAAKAIWEHQGCDVISLHTERTGHNINEQAGSTDIRRCRAAVLSHRADMGVAFDGDGDRVVLIDEKGNELDGDDIVYILAHHMRDHTEGVVTTVMSNGVLNQALTKLGLVHKRVAVGDKHIAKALAQEGWQLGGEPSGHIMILPHSRSGDGALSGLACAMVAFSLKEKLSDWREALVKYPKKLVNYPLLTSDVRQAEWEDFLQDLQDQSPEIDMLLRKSGTEPLFRVTVEAQNATALAAILATIEKKYAQYLV
jgi:phosphoglucosamine mutase